MSAPDRSAGNRALLRFLARQGRITNDDVTRVEGVLEEAGIAVHDVLEREGIINQKDLALLLAETLRLRIVDLTTYPLDANVTRELKENIATRYEVVPIGIDERTIEVVTANPLDLDGLKAVEFATGKRVTAVVATHVEVKDALAHTYRLQESLEQFLQLVPAGESLVVNELSDEGGDLRTIAADAELPPVIKLADKMLIEGIKTRASDIHVEPETDSVLVRYRVDGILEEAFRFPKWIQNPLVARLKVMAKLDITERRLPQDGRIQVRYADKSVDMRVSSLPAQHGEKITLRILDASQAVKAVDRLGISPGDLKILREAAKKPQGMILITGPTGSGKTTTLYALLREIFSPKTNIVTIENPIEYQLKGINQVEVNEKQGLTFGGVLRSVLRQDPDVILLGEIRDKETAQIAFQAASTGHLVLSTVHTNDAAGAVTRLIDLGLEPYAIASALNLVVAQRLVRQLCPTCSKPATVDPETQRHLHLDDASTVKQAVGCAQCRHGGYRSRMGVYEMLPMTSAITKLIEAGAGESMVRQQARSEGVHTILEDAVEKLKAGITTVDELQRVVQITEGTSTQCPGCQKEIAEDYSVCPHCSKVLHASCGGCAKPLSPEWVRCPYCGAAAVVEESPAAAPVERRSFKALVVDDTSTIRDVVRHTLEHSDLGLGVVTAENGPEALELAARERPDIVILDISMPGMDGFEVCRRLRSEMRTAFVPVLMLTAHDSEDDVARGFGVGADDYMVKPFRREGLVARVRRILERTYGSQAIGAPPLPDTAIPASATPVEAPTAYAAAPSADVSARLAELAADRDALRNAMASCETRLGELAARPAAAAPDAVVDPAALVELRTLLSEMQAGQERRLEELRGEAQRAATVAEEALTNARASAAALPAENLVADLAAVASSVERLYGEQASFRSALAAATSDAHGVDEECERRLRETSAEIEELRTSAATLQASWQRELQALRGETRTVVEETGERVQSEVASAIGRVGQSLAAMQNDLATQREELSRESGRIRAAEAQTGRVQDEALAATERVARELAALQRTLAEQQDQRSQDGQRLASVEETARRLRAEAQAAIDQTTEEMGTLRRTLAAQHGGGGEMAGTVARLDGDLGALRQILDAQRRDVAAGSERMADTAATVQRLREEIAAATGRTASELGELRRLVAMQQEVQSATGTDREASEAAWQNLQREAVAAAELAARAIQSEAAAAIATDVRAARADAIAAAETARNVQDQTRIVHAEIVAAAERTAAGLAELRESVATRQGTQQEQLVWLQDRLEQARRTAVKLVRRVMAAGREAEARATAREAECEQEISAVREHTVAMLAGMRQEHTDFAQDVEERLKDLPSAAEQHAMRTYLDACETQVTALAARLDAQGTTSAVSDVTARQHLATDLQELKGVVERLEGAHHRHAADVEERLRGLMRTAAGGFDVQLALLRGKVEVLARTLREQVPIDQAAPSDDALLQHRHGLLDTLRQQLLNLQSGTEWGPQRVIDLLIESTLAAAITPFRRMLQLAQGREAGEAETSTLRAVAAPTASTVTDESASPS